MLLLLLASIALANPPIAAADPLSSAGIERDELPEVDEDHGPSRIIHGEAAALEDFPMTGGLIAKGKVFNFDGRVFVCSSTLIAPDVVLTAAHCLDLDALVQAQYGVKIEDLSIHWSRQADLRDFSEKYVGDLPSDAIEAVDWQWHEGWTGEVRGPLWQNHDIGLMFLSEVVEGVAPAVLPTPEEVVQIVSGNAVQVVGWGQTTSDQQPPPGTVGVKMWGDSQIEDMASFEFQVGATSDDVRKCHGDSGGPTFMAVESESTAASRLIGVTSHSYDHDDCKESGGVDTRVDFYLDWIDARMRDGCEDGTRVWCDGEQGILAPPLPEPEKKLACGCRASGGRASWIGVVAGLLVMGRRRR